jgi:hypothetical protein
MKFVCKNAHKFHPLSKNLRSYINLRIKKIGHPGKIKSGMTNVCD